MALVTHMLQSSHTQPSTAPPPPAPTPSKPFKDQLPTFLPYTGADSPETFLAAFRTQVFQSSLREEELPRQLITKLSGEALAWFNMHFAGQETPATVAEIAYGLRTAFGKEYEGANAYRDTWHVPANLTLDGKDRLRALNQQEELARNHRVPLAPGAQECRFYKLLDLFSPSERSRLFAELTANVQCSERALRQLEESALAGGALGPSRASLLVSPSLDREALFAMRVELTEAALNRITISRPAAPRDRPARVLMTNGATPEPPSAGITTSAPPSAPSPTQADAPPAPAAAAECLVLRERLAAVDGRGFRGPPQYFGTNDDPDRKKQNQEEFIRRRNAGICFKCTQAEVSTCPFIACPRHGAEAVKTGAAKGAPSVRRARTA